MGSSRFHSRETFKTFQKCATPSLPPIPHIFSPLYVLHCHLRARSSLSAAFTPKELDQTSLITACLVACPADSVSFRQGTGMMPCSRLMVLMILLTTATVNHAEPNVTGAGSSNSTDNQLSLNLANLPNISNNTNATDNRQNVSYQDLPSISTSATGTFIYLSMKLSDMTLKKFGAYRNSYREARTFSESHVYAPAPLLLLERALASRSNALAEHYIHLVLSRISYLLEV